MATRDKGTRNDSQVKEADGVSLWLSIMRSEQGHKASESLDVDVRESGKASWRW